MREEQGVFRDELLTAYTRYSTKNTDKDHALICTHGYLGSKDMYGVSTVSKNFVDTILSEEGRESFSIDMFAHGETAGEHYDFTLSKVYTQLEALYCYLQDEGYEKNSLHGISASSPAILKLATNYAVEKILLRVPVIDPYQKRLRELGVNGMEKWEKDGEITVFNDNSGNPVIHSYGFIEDVLENFDEIKQKKLSGKIHIVGGGSDEEVLPLELLQFVDALNKIYSEDKASLVLYENQGHVFDSAITPNIQDFFEEGKSFFDGGVREKNLGKNDQFIYKNL